MSQTSGKPNRCPECGEINPPKAMLCHNCGAPLPKMLSSDNPPVGSNEPPTDSGRINLQNFGQESPTSGEVKLSRFAQAAKKRQESQPTPPANDDMPDWLNALRADLPDPSLYPKYEDDFESGDGEEELPPFLSDERLESLNVLSDERLESLNATSMPPRPPLPGEQEIDEPPPRPTKPGSGELPGWMRDLSNTGQTGEATPGGRELDTGGTIPYNPDPLYAAGPISFTPSENLSPFELDPVEKGMGTGPLKLPSTEDLSGGVPDWLRQLGSPSNPKNTKQSNVLNEQPIFEPKNDNIPGWLAEEDGSGDGPSPEEQSNPRVDVPNWLRTRKNKPGTDGIARPSFGDFELEKALEEAFDETDTPVRKKTASIFENLDSFELTELPTLDPGLPKSGITNSYSAKTQESGDTGGLTGIDDLFMEIDEADLPPITANVQPPTLPASELDEIGEPDLLGVESSPIGIADMLANLSKLTGPLTEPEAAKPVVGVPWGDGLAPWLKGAVLPSYTAPEKEVPLDQLSPFSPGETAADSEGTKKLEQPARFGEELNSSDLNIPSIGDMPSWLEQPANPPLEPPAPSTDTNETRPISLRDLIRQTDELSRTMGDTVPEFAPPKTKVPPLPAFLDDDDEDAEPEELRPFDLVETPSIPTGEKEESLFGDVMSAEFPVWLGGGTPEPTPPGGIKTDELPPLSLDDTPSWLKESVAEVAEVSPPIFASNTEAVAAEAADSEGSLPDWLSNGEEVGEPRPEEMIPDWLGSAADLTDSSAKPAEEMPDWLGTPEELAVDLPQESDVPDWLNDLGATAAEQPATTEPEAMPDWLGQTAVEKEVSPTESTRDVPDWLGGVELEMTPPPEDIPDWLKAANSEQAVAEPALPTFAMPAELPKVEATPDEAGASQSDMPDWLAELEAAKPAESAEEEPEPPAWLKQMGSGTLPSRAPVEAPKSYSQVGSYALDQQLENVPDWLKNEGDKPKAETSAKENATIKLPAEGGDAQVGALLREIAMLGDDAQSPATMPDWLQPQTKAQVEPEFTLPIGNDIPDWLSEDTNNSALAQQVEPISENLPPPKIAEQSSPPFAGGITNENFLGDLEAPSWMRGPTRSQEPAKPVESPAINSADFTPGQLPAWLRTVAPSATEEPLANDDPSRQGSAMFPEVFLPPTLAGAAVLETLLKPTVVEVPAPKKSTGFNLDQPTIYRYVTFLLLLLAVVAGLLLTPQANLTVPVRSETRNFFNAVDSLPANSKVLVAYDWEGDKVGEMRPLSQSISQHIMSRRARLVTISLNPQGPAFASQITNDLATNPEYGNNTTGLYDYGKGYLNLGYHPGNEAAVRGLFNNLSSFEDYKNGWPASSFPVMAGINGLADFDLIVILAGDESSVRVWVEQAGIQPGARLLLATPAAVEPFAQPYAQGITTARPELVGKTVRVQGLVAGLNGATQYAQLLRDRNLEPASRLSNLNSRLNAQNFAVLMLVGILVVVNVYNAVQMIRRRRGAE